MGSEAYDQVYATGPSRGGSSASVVDGVSGAFYGALAAIDKASTASEKNHRCKELLRTLSQNGSTAYEWNAYYDRCQQMKP